MKAKNVLLIVLAIFLVLLTACSSNNGGNEDKTSTPESTDSTAADESQSTAELSGKLVIWTWFDQVEIMADKFMEAHPGVTIDVQVFPGDQYETKILSALQSGKNVPDIFDLERGYIGKFVDSKFVADLSAMGGDELVKDFIPLIDAYGRSSDGKLRAVTDNSSPGGFWYIRENAKKYLGTDDPDQISSMVDSWDKVIELGKKVYNDSNGKVHLISDATFLTAIMGYNTTPWVTDGKTLTIDPKWKETYEMQQKIRENNVDAKLPFMSAGWGSALNDGSVLLTPMPSWAVFMVDNKDNKAHGKFGVAKTPVGFFLGGRYEAIYEKSENKELAFEVMKFIASPDWQQYNLEKTNNMPSNGVVFEKNQDTYKSPFFGDQLFMKDYYESQKAMPSIPANKYNEDILSKWGDVSSEGIDSNKSFDEVVAAFKKEVKNTYPELQVD